MFFIVQKAIFKDIFLTYLKWNKMQYLIYKRQFVIALDVEAENQIEEFT